MLICLINFQLIAFLHERRLCNHGQEEFVTCFSFINKDQFSLEINPIYKASELL